MFNLSLLGCVGKDDDADKIIFAVSADYPPFEYKVGNEFEGFDIDVAKQIALKLNKEVEFHDMSFASIFAAVESGRVDAGISTVTITEKREQNFDFSVPYYSEVLSILYSHRNPIMKAEHLSGKTVSCLLGSTMEIWARENLSNSNIITTDNNNQSVQFLSSGRVDAVIIDSVLCGDFSRHSNLLMCSKIGNTDSAYAILLKKGSKLKSEIDSILHNLENEGILNDLKIKHRLVSGN